MPKPSGPTSSPRPRWIALAFLLGFAAMIVVVAVHFLLPALDAARSADPAGRRQLAAYSSLLLAVLLVILLAGLLLTLRIGRFFFPRATPPRTATPYVDAWAESARRMETPPPSDGE